MKTTTRKTLVLIAVNLFVFFLFLFLKCSAFEGNDDEMMNLIAAGAYGHNGNHLIYSGILLEWILGLLYRIPLKINYYILWSQTLAFLSLTAVSCTAFSKMPLWKAVLSALFLNLFLANDFYVSMQYTKLAALAAVSGMMVIHDAYRNRSLPESTAGIILFLLGLSVRKESALFTVPFCIWWLLEDFRVSSENFTEFRIWKQENGRRLLKILTASALSSAAVLLVSRLPYQSKKWKEYEAFNRMRTSLLDYGMADYESHAEEYVNSGISYEDYKLLSEYVYADTEVFTTEKLRKIDAISGGRDMRINLQNVWTHFISAVQNGTYPHLLILLLAAAGIVKWKKNIFLIVLISGLVIAEYGFLGLLGRIITRVEIGIWLSACLVMLYEIARQKTEDRKLVLLGVNVLIGLEGVRSADLLVRQIRLNQDRFLNPMCAEYFVEDVANQSGNLYLMDEKTIYRGGRIFGSPYAITSGTDQLFVNVIPLGGWEYPAPFLMDDFQEFGVTNPLRDLLYKDNIYLATVNQDGLTDILLSYLREHYDPSAEMKNVNKVNGIGIYEYYIPG